jgi:uncharacterized protein YndB with AHSA1/START domain
MSPETTETTRVEPLRKTITVDASVEHAFEVFTERMGEWWPAKTHSAHKELADEAGLEPRLGGAIFELWRGGRENWGEITVWEPPHRLVFTWHPGLRQEETTEVEVRFAAAGDSTVVELEHRGWEARGDQAAEVRANYDQGWIGVLEQYAKAAAA